MTFNSFFNFATGFCARHRGDLREGQAFMVALSQCHAALYSRITDNQEMGIDPFYDDRNIRAFLCYVENHWETTFVSL